MANPQVEIYTTMMCPYCYRAKALLKQKNASFKEIDVSMDRQTRAKMTERANGSHTVPQIFVGERHVGGCDDLYALEQKGELDALLQG